MTSEVFRGGKALEEEKTRSTISDRPQKEYSEESNHSHDIRDEDLLVRKCFDSRSMPLEGNQHFDMFLQVLSSRSGCMSWNSSKRYET